MKKIKNNKGFTLIELLAVIVILGILMIVAIPAVTKYINNSKKDAFSDNAVSYINSIRYSMLNDEYDCQTPGADGQVVYVKLFHAQAYDNSMAEAYSNVNMDKGLNKSAYGYNYDDDSYVKVEYRGGKLVYSICLIDVKGNGTDGIVEESVLNRNAIKVKNAQCTSVPNSYCYKK